MEKCCICSKTTSDGTPTVILQSKGSNSVNRASEKRGLLVSTVSGDRVHVECRRRFCKPTNIARDIATSVLPDEKKCHLRSVQKPFSFQEHCLFCGQYAKCDNKRREVDVFPVRTKDFQESVLEICHSRNDKWSETVSGRLSSVHDLHAADALYHQQCSCNFRTGKDIPRKVLLESGETPKRFKAGRPEENERTAAFIKVAQFMEETEEEQTTINELVLKMTKYLENTDHEPYSAKYMKTKIQQHFGERVVMTVLNTKECVVTLRDTASSILYAFHKQTKPDNDEDDKMSIIKAAAKLIVSDVKSIEVQNDTYPGNENIASANSAVNYIPKTLQVLLRTMFSGKSLDMKVASIGQCIMQAIRPRSILAPLQLGLGVQMHHHFASRFLIDTLHEHGFSCSYAEVKKFERSAAVVQGTDIAGFTQEHYIQYIADNVDHNVATIDGTGTFHGMGIVAVITPQIQTQRPVPKVSVTAMDIAAVGRINIEYFNIPPIIQQLTYLPLVHTIADDPTSQLDVLWKASLLLRSPRPAWSGMMQMLHHGQYPGQSSMVFLPMIDLDPSDPTCIYSTLKFVSSQAMRYGVTPVLTFDQPLYWKALSIIRSEPVDSHLRRMILRLGGFHMSMSFLGSIGHLMAGSGLQDLLEVVYASNTVSHMLTGKAVSRAVRGHMLVDAALNTILLASAYNVPVPTKVKSEDPNGGMASDGINTNSDTTDLKTATEVYDKAISSTLSVEEVCLADVLTRIQSKLNGKKDGLITQRTAKLWMQYMDMVDILRRFLKAERTGNWKMHLQSVHEMLPFFAASGHTLYAKSAYVYLQMMLNLPETHPHVSQKFEQGYHVVRRSDRYWAGLSTDLIIEQVLMRSIKTSGGLTRGKGMTETQRLVWVLSMPACANINDAMQKLTGVSYETSGQHKDISPTRQSRDVSDTLDLIIYLDQRDPFVNNSTLFNIANGMTAQEGVNVERSKEIGEKILSSMVGKSVEEFVFRKADQAITLGTRSTVKIKGECVKVDPQLIFQRLIAVGKCWEDLQGLFKYELCGHPPALFESSSLPLQANKATLGDAIWKTIQVKQREPSGNVQYILDGGALLHRLPWPRGSTFDYVCELYTNYVMQKYSSATIVFDGYNDHPSTKDATHMRRTGACSGVTVYFTGGMVIQSRKEEFLNNAKNKQRFIAYLGNKLERAGCSTIHAKQDADVLIVQTAITSARKTDTVLVGDDTDLLILLLHYVEMEAHDLFLAPEPKQSSRKKRIWCMKQSKQLLGSDVCEHALFLHAILGCDTTSRLFGLGKGLALKKIMSDALFCHQARIFSQTKEIEDKKIITEAGEHALVSLYGGSEGEGLDSLRYKRFCEKVTKTLSHVEPQTLPPTSAAARYHSLRVFHQIMEWKGINMDPLEWGWHMVDGLCLPIQTDHPAAPSALLDIICCNCKKDCNTRRCTCRKYGLTCSAVCGECHGTSCTNAELPDFSEEDEPC